MITVDIGSEEKARICSSTYLYEGKEDGIILLSQEGEFVKPTYTAIEKNNPSRYGKDFRVLLDEGWHPFVKQY